MKKGATHTPEVRARLAEAARQQAAARRAAGMHKQSPETIAKRVETRRRNNPEWYPKGHPRKNDPQISEKISATKIERYGRASGPEISEEVRQRLSKARNGVFSENADAYSTIHGRLQKVRGAASNYTCIHCRAAAAATWAYNHDHATEHRVDPVHGFPYSMNLEDYIPLCRSCHGQYDRGRDDH